MVSQICQMIVKPNFELKLQNLNSNLIDGHELFVQDSVTKFVLVVFEMAKNLVLPEKTRLHPHNRDKGNRPHSKLLTLTLFQLCSSTAHSLRTLATNC